MENKENYKISQDKAEKIMGDLRTIFDVVRILKAEEVAGQKEIVDCPEPCMCYAYWKKNKTCEHCISLKSLETKKDFAKIEFCDDSFFRCAEAL